MSGPPVPEGPLGEESELLDGVRAGEPEAMEILYERYREPGLRLVRGLMSGAQEAEDVFHEAFVKAVGAIRNGHGPTDVFGAYLNTSIRSVTLTLWKKRGREQPAPDEELEVESGAVEDPGLETALSLFEHEKVAAAMRSLPKRWRTVLWHAEIQGMPPRDIAPLMGIGANAVSALLIRARAGLRAAYEQQTLVREPGSSIQEKGARG
ncbi:RNA polymerase sigma factor [Arthrobacter bambusae]|uniref:RNA polymerase sigma factor (Sigma-70 family) n=1 Tax=Arthrobacter bambusae TaxID=1338426 RepID=A0AAW8DC99_9MICC|nr:sigma-70 family RNA polymerase sigma factor [Arthrobacter bambusae]MDP9903242.1 RNA polymerase sigma factor (sigma-70 family) [Arthrobacter bambusae]MDQ0128764.1 RNA polymerase sigma factor (sigma-70 family) [Arthrobacter bambusae]MDQ0180105.1 RNA polymerase sigma factor (sigma-70 family) [Arthrobacter bambusae]